MGCKSISKLMLLIFNVGFFLLGAVALALGIWVLVDQGSMSTLLNMAPDGTIPSNVNVVSLLDAGAYVLIAVGGFIFVVGGLGFCGACTGNRGCLIMYAVIVLLIVCIEITGGVLAYFYQDTVKTHLQTFLNTTIKTKYQGMTISGGNLVAESTEVYTIAWDTAQITLGCCGLTSHTDFENYATMWNRTITYGGSTFQAKVPVSCCKFVDKTKFPADMANLQFVNASECLTNPTTTSANIDAGCYATVLAKITTYSTIVIGVGIGVGCLEILGIIFACCLQRSLAKVDSD